MRVEGDETSLLSRSMDPASGGWQWYFRTGSVITLAELLYWARNILTCFDLYTAYLQMPVLFHRRVHSVSHSEQSQKRRNAKQLHYQEHGMYGLPHD